VSTRGSRLRTWLAGIFAVAMVVGFGGSTWDGWNGRFPDRSDPRLLAEGTTGGARWTVLQIHERDHGDCLHLRQDGASADRWCKESGFLGRYEVGVRLLRGASRPVIFGVLPAGAARAEVAADGGDTAPRFRKAAMIPLPVRAFGESGRYVVEPVPDGAAWDRDSVQIDVYDAGGRRLAP
jgi:hypothetical protein